MSAPASDSPLGSEVHTLPEGDVQELSEESRFMLSVTLAPRTGFSEQNHPD